MTGVALGFGTASILGRVGRKPGIAALERAYDLGIRHFDTARSYGWGEAESVVGSVLGRYPRSSYTLVSKCGIVPVKPSLVLSAAKELGRQVNRWVPGAAKFVRRAASTSMVQPSRTYDVNVLESSLDTSLRELGTDYLDVLLLHGFMPGAPLDDVLHWFERECARGRIRKYGFSAEGPLVESLKYLRDHGALNEAIVQVPLTDALLTLGSEWAATPKYVHSAFRYFGEHPAESPREILTQLEARFGQVLVCSMFTPGHIEANLKMVSGA